MRYWFWRLRTRLLLPFVANKWREQFHASPHLFNARHYEDFLTMAGYYNDQVPGGFMTAQQAERIYRGKQHGRSSDHGHTQERSQVVQC